MNALVQARRHSPLFRNLVRREVRQRYRASAFGMLWTLINPLVVVGAYWFVFRFVFPTSANAPFALFLFVGLTTWSFFMGGSQAAASSLVANANLVTKVRVPRALVPVSTMTAQWVTATIMLGLSVILCAFFGHGDRITWIAIPPILIMLCLLTAGFGLILSVVNVYFRDIEHILAALALPWFFLTPILFSLDQVPDSSEWAENVLHYGNFVTPFVLAIRDPLFDGVWPAGGDVVYCAVASFLMFGIGVLVFRRLERDVAIEL